jgi:TonB family protein
MIIQWMLHIAAVSALLALAGLAAERALRLWHLQARLAWMVTMILSLALPAVSLVQALGWLPSFGQAETDPSALTARLVVLLPRVTISGATTNVGLVVATIWAIATVVLTLRFVTAARALARRRRAWRAAVVDGQHVLVSRDAGPAVIGFRAPAVVVPEWVLGLDASLRALVLTHEREHLERGDPRLLLAAVAVAVCAPWNPALWFQLYKLRSAMELDCDLRVLRAYPDARKYGSLLLVVAQRADRGGLLAAALTESTSLLGRRIRAMRQSTSRHRAVASYVLAAATVAIAVVACEMKSPNGPKEKVVAQSALTPGSAGKPTFMPEGVTYFEFQVEKPVTPAPGSRSPRYPDLARQAGLEGEVLAQFVVDTMGRAEPSSLKILKSSHDLFVESVRNALPEMRFVPAEVGGRKVKQLVQEPFTYSLAR